MTISVAMATYNGSRFLGEQLESLARQTLLPCELVVGDDQSSDDTVAIIESFARTAPFPVRLQRNEHRYGFADNFLRTARQCRGEWVAFCDQDDVWTANKLQRVAEVGAAQPDVLLVAHRATITDEALVPTGVFPVPPFRSFRVFESRSHGFWWCPYGFTQVFRRQPLLEFSFRERPESNHDEWIFWLADVVGRTAFLPDELALYRRHGAAATEFPPPVGVIAQLTATDRGPGYINAAERVEGFVRCISASADRLPAAMQTRIALATDAYTRLAGALRRRAVIWTEQETLAVRAKTFVRNLASGGYGRRQAGGTGWRAGLKDLARLFIT